MWFWSKFFGSKEKTQQRKNIPEECLDIAAVRSFMDGLLNADHYVAKSEFRQKIELYSESVHFFEILRNSGTLKEYCRKNKIGYDETLKTISDFATFDSLINLRNDSFVEKKLVSEKDYLDNILLSCDPEIRLDDDQRRVVITDEDYCLVVAGAGAGKTTTVAAKVKYLVDKQNIDPKQILVISFTNKAVNELKQRINTELRINCPIATFHSTGNAIIRKQNPEKLNIAEESKLYYVVRDYLKSSVLMKESTVNSLILFFASYFDTPIEEDLPTFLNHLAKANYSTMKSEVSDYQREIIDTRTKKKVTIQSEVMRSRQEVEIANFLFLNNIDYEYEPLYPYNILCSRKPYTPDFVIRQGDKVAYIEHFGITEDGRSNRFSPDELEFYKKAINDKINLHRQHGTVLISTYSSFLDGRSITDHLKESLESAGFVLSPKPSDEVMRLLVSSEENRYIRSLVMLICRFISNFKTDGYELEDFNRMYRSTSNVRTKLFLDICSDCYFEYQKYLKQNGMVDFQDMINESARILREVKEVGQKLDFKYIIVDEYQDISRQRFDLVKALHEVCDAKIVAVGDDWQSIYAFSGSDISLFTQFDKKMGYAKMLKIVNTYRNSQEVIDIAGSFILKNSEQIQKELVSPKRIDNPVIIYTYDSTRKDAKGDNRSGTVYSIAYAVQTALEEIIEYNKKEGKPVNSPILLLGRYNFDGDRLEQSGLFEYTPGKQKLKSVKYPLLDITFMTAHASKGLGFDNVIIINGRNETFGFPSKIEDDPVLSLVVRQDRSIEFAEERRLFYVAMTRTKNRVFFVAPVQNPSEFLLEIKRDYHNVVLRGSWNENPVEVGYSKKPCPMCGYPMQFRYKNAFGLRLYICTNEPEVCGFMTNEYKAGKLSIMKCDQCRDGYLIVKPARDVSEGYFLGCTNYKKDGTGCRRTMTRAQFYSQMGIAEDVPTSSAAFRGESDIIPGEKAEIQIAEPETVTESSDSDVIVKADFDSDSDAVRAVNEDIYAILCCVSDISRIRFFGISTLADVLRGSESKTVSRFRLNETEWYGKLSELPRIDLLKLINWMIGKKLIRLTRGKYQVLHPTYEGTHYSEFLSRKLIEEIAAIVYSRTDG